MATTTTYANRYSLLASNARIQVPWIKVTLKTNKSEFTFGAFTKTTRSSEKDLSKTYNVQYPNYVQDLSIVKINGQVNQYTLNIVYPITVNDDPNFFEKIFSSSSKTRKMILTYGDASMPAYIYKEESAIITAISQQFDLASSKISYTINAVSDALMTTSGCANYNAMAAKPSDVIKTLFRTSRSLQKTFTGMNLSNLDTLIAGDDAKVYIKAKTNISEIDYLRYLASCMYSINDDVKKPTSMYIFTLHDSNTADKFFNSSSLYYSESGLAGPYFKVTKVSYTNKDSKSDAYEIDVGVNTSTIVKDFRIDNNENYALYYDYQESLTKSDYVKQLNNKGQWEDVYAPTMLSRNDEHRARQEDITWWTKITQYPINATITVQGLLRPAQLLTHVRLNVIFPGGHKHISSGLYIITKQTDRIGSNGYTTELAMTKVGGALLDQKENDIELNSYTY